MYFVAHGHLEVRVYYEDPEKASSLDEVSMSMKASEVGFRNNLSGAMQKGHPTTMDLKNAWRTISVIGASESYKKIGKLRKGEYFGEYSCLLGTFSVPCETCFFSGEYRTATVVAEDYCELYSLSRSDLDTILDEMPELGIEFLKMVEGYVAAGYGESPLNPNLNRIGRFQKDPPPS